MEDYLHGLHDHDNKKTSTGRRTHNPLHTWVENRAARFQWTPDYDPFAIIRILKEYGLRMPPNEETGAKWTKGLLLHIEMLVSKTSKKDWQDRQAIVWMSIETTAKLLNICERQVRLQEKQLSKLGVLFWNDSGNGKRHGQRNRDGSIRYAFGPNITALGTILNDLQEAKKKIDEEDRERKEGKNNLSSLRSRYRALYDYAFENIRTQEKRYTQIMKITEEAKELITKKITLKTGIDSLNDLIAKLYSLIKRLTNLLHPLDDEQAYEICGQSCGQTHTEPQKEAKKDQLGTPKSYYQACKKEEGTYSTKPSPKKYISKSTISTAEPEEPAPPSPETTHKPDKPGNYQKEGDNLIAFHPKHYETTSVTVHDDAYWEHKLRAIRKQQKKDYEDREEIRLNNVEERYQPQLVRKQIDLTQLYPYTPYHVRNQWDGTWEGLHNCVHKWQEDLGIPKEMVEEATSIMGSDGVAIAILITLWKKDLYMIRKNPAAYFGGMIKKARLGYLNLPKTIYSLQNRSKYG